MKNQYNLNTQMKANLVFARVSREEMQKRLDQLVETLYESTCQPPEKAILLSSTDSQNNRTYPSGSDQWN